MSTTNGDREVYLAFLRKTEQRKEPSFRPSWMPADAPGNDTGFRIVVIACAIVLAGAIAAGIWQHEQVKPWAVQVAEECERSGKVPHVERGADGRVLGVRCDKRPEDIDSQ